MSALFHLHRREIPIGVVSNASGQIEGVLAAQGVCQVGRGGGVPVAVVVDSEVVGVMKPDARIFRLALDAMDLEPEECWYVGDMPGIDVVGARRVGMHPIVMDPLGLHRDADYDRCDSLADLAGRLAR